MRRGIIAGTMLLLLLGLAVSVAIVAWPEEETTSEAILPSASPTLPLAPARLTVNSPMVEWRSSTTQPWQSAFTLMVEGNLLQTRNGGNATVTFFDQITLQIGDESLIEVLALRGQDTTQANILLNLVHGNLMATVGEVNLFQIQTAMYTLSAKRATFHLMVNGTTSEVTVEQGQVLLVTQGGQSQVVTAGMALSASLGEELAAPRPASTATFTPTATLTWSPTHSITDTNTPTPSFTSTPTVTWSPSHNVTVTDTPSFTPTPTVTWSPTLENTTATFTPSHVSLTPSFTFTSTYTATNTSSPTIRATLTASHTPSATSTPTLIPTNTPRPTQTASLTPVPECVGRIVATGGLFVRTIPDPEGTTIVALPFNATVTLIGQSNSGNWYKVEHPDAPQGGWMASNLLETTEDCRINMPTVQ